MSTINPKFISLKKYFLTFSPDYSNRLNLKQHQMKIFTRARKKKGKKNVQMNIETIATEMKGSVFDKLH